MLLPQLLFSVFSMLQEDISTSWCEVKVQSRVRHAGRFVVAVANVKIAQLIAEKYQ